MKIQTALFPLLFLPVFATAQRCSEYGDVIKKLNQAYRDEKFEAAIPLVSALRDCAPDSEAVAQKWTTVIFDGIKKQKEDAEAAEKKARDAQKAEIKSREAAYVALDAAKTARKTADSLARQAEKEARLSKILGIAYEADKRGDRTLALQLSDYVCRESNDANYLARKLRHELLLDTLSIYRNIHVGHSSPLSAIVFSPDGRQMLTTANDAWALLRTVPDGVLLQIFHVRAKPAAAVAFTPDGQRVLILEKNSVIHTWKTSGEHLRTDTLPHPPYLGASVFSPDCKRLLLRTPDSIYLHNFEGGKPIALQINRSANSLAFSPDGQAFLVGTPDSVRVFQNSGALIVKVLAPKDTSHKQEDRFIFKKSIFSNDGKSLLIAGTNGRPSLWKLDDPARPAQRFAGDAAHAGGVNNLIFSKNGKSVLTIGPDGNLKRWDIGGRLQAASPVQVNYISTLSLSPDGKFLYFGFTDGTVKTRIVETLEKTTGKTQRDVWHQTTVTAAAVSPDGKWMASASSNYLLLTELKTEKSSGVELSDFRCNDIFFAADGKTLKTVSSDGFIRVWDLNGREISITAQKITNRNGQFSPDGKTVFSHGSSSKLRLWDATSGALRREISTPKDIQRAEIAPNSPCFLVVGKADSLFVFDTFGTKISAFWPNPKVGISTATFSPDGKKILTVSREDSCVSIWSLTGELLKKFSVSKKMEAMRGGFSPDGASVLVAGQWRSFVKFFDLESGREKLNILENSGSQFLPKYLPGGQGILVSNTARQLNFYDFSGKRTASFANRSRVQQLEVLPDGKQMVVLLDNGTVAIEDFAGNEIRKLDAPAHDATLVVSPTGKHVLLNSEDKFLLFEVGGAQIAALSAGQHLMLFGKFSPDGQTILTGCTDSVAYLWNLEGKKIRQIKLPLPRVVSGDFSKDGKEIRFIAATGSDDRDTSAVFVWMERLATVVKMESYPKHLQPRIIRASPTRDQWLIGNDDGSVALFEKNGKDTLRIFNEPENREDGLDALALPNKPFSPDGRYFLTKNVTSVTLWSATQTAENYPLESLFFPSGVNGVSFLPSGNELAVVCTAPLFVKPKTLNPNLGGICPPLTLAQKLKYYLIDPKICETTTYTGELAECLLLENEKQGLRIDSRPGDLQTDLVSEGNDGLIRPVHVNPALYRTHALARTYCAKNPAPELKTMFVFLTKRLEISRLDSASEMGEQIAELRESIKSAKQRVSKYLSKLQTTKDTADGKAGFISACNTVGFYSIFVGEPDTAIRYIELALAFDKDTCQGVLYTNLVLGYLFKGQWEKAREIYTFWKDLSYFRSGGSARYKTYGDAFRGDLVELDEAGMTHPDIKKAKELLQQKDAARTALPPPGVNCGRTRPALEEAPD